MISSFRFMFSTMEGGVDGGADYEKDILTLDFPSGPLTFSLSHALHVLHKPYHIVEPDAGWRTDFADAEEKANLRPIAETLAMLDGNAFFGCEGSNDQEWYESYLPEASAIYDRNGGADGWAGAASFVKPSNTA